jgi:hypothetical protein
MATKAKVAAEKPKCQAPGCKKDADYEVILYDVYVSGEVFFERDFTCPFLCEKHVAENERGAETYADKKSEGAEFLANVKDLMESVTDRVSAGSVRKYRGSFHYPYTNQHVAQGFTIYRPIE